MEILDINRILSAKQSYATRRVDLKDCRALITANYKPKPGDLMLARVVDIGSHSRIELPTGRKSKLHIGDEILLAYGNRYAPDQYEAYVPQDLGPCHMVAGGGIAASARSWHSRLSGPTSIEPAGVLCNADGVPINLKQYVMADTTAPMPQIIFGVFGTSMNAGKTATVASLVRGLSNAGYSTGAAKITGTASGGDPWLMRDLGAVAALDFTDVGFATTFLEPVSALLSGTQKLLHNLGALGCEAAVVEIADGINQEETAELSRHPLIKTLFDGVLFAAGDALGAVSGAERLLAQGHNVLGISGAVMRSPLAAREISYACHLPRFDLCDLQDPAIAANLMRQVEPTPLAVAE